MFCVIVSYVIKSLKYYVFFMFIIVFCGGFEKYDILEDVGFSVWN